MTRLTIRIDLGENAAFGPGKARLLELIGDTGSIRQAAVAMEMSYRRAWLLLQETEALMNTPVIAARAGGKKGGGTVLTQSGRAVVECYRAIEARAGEATAAELAKFVAMTKHDPSVSIQHKKVTRNRPASGKK